MRSSIDPKHVAEMAGLALGVNIAVSYNVAGQSLDFRVAGLEKPNGFTISVRQRLTMVRASLVLDSLAGHLQADISGASNQAWEEFNRVLASGEYLGVQIDQNQSQVQQSSSDKLPKRSFELSGKAVFEDDKEEEPIAALVALMCGAVFELLPLEKVYEGHSEFGDRENIPLEFAEEGYATRRSVNHYERSRANRAVAILLHGYTCHVCNFNFENAYGQIGKGFVEVHHVNPVHAMGGSRVVDPRSELVPLCSNCHSMVHRKTPPYAPRELKALLESELRGK